jgi:adenylate cyclase
MPTERVERRLAAILAADVAGYSRLMGIDEEGTLARLKACRRQLADPKIKEYRGRIVKTTGDGMLLTFTSVLDAVRCAVEVQREMAQQNADVPLDRRIEFRMGINLGDIIKDGGDIYGDGVNIAARLEALAEPGGICISSVVREQIRDKLAFPLDDMGERQVKNIARPVHAYRVVLSEGGASLSPPAKTLAGTPPALPDKPSIAVLPFQNMSGDPEQEYFSDGMVEEIITALSRIRWLFVIARNSSFTYKGQAVDVKQVGKELGVRYVLEGSVRKAGNHVRITGQLIDAVTDVHIWADHFDGTLDNIFELQDQVASSVAGVIEPALLTAEMRRSARVPTNDLTAYDLFLRAQALATSWEKGAIIRALDMLEQAIERDPDYGEALVQAAARHFELHVNGWTDDPDANRRKGTDLCRRALQVAGDDPNVLSRAGYTLGYFGEDIQVAIALLDRSLKLNPNSAVSWQWSAWLRLWVGQPEIAIRHFETSLRLTPREQRANPFMGIGVAHFFSRRYEEAKTVLLQSLQEKPNWVPTYRFLASCLAHMGRFEEARETVVRLRSLTNIVVPDAMHWRNAEHRELYLSGLRLAVEA